MWHIDKGLTRTIDPGPSEHWSNENEALQYLDLHT